MTYQQKQVALQPMETDIEPSPLPFQEHCTTVLPFITVPDEDSAYALQVAPNCDSAMLPQGIENLEGKRVIEIPVFESMTHYLMSKEGADKRLTLYSFLNDLLRKGRLSGIVGFQVLNRVINRQVCDFTDFRYWEFDRQEFIADISVTLTLKSKEGPREWKGVLACYCGFTHQFYMTVEELVSQTDRASEGYVPLDNHLIQIFKGYQIDQEAELMWVRYKLQEALTNPDKRKARDLAASMGLTVLRLPIYEHKGLNSILFFEGGTLLVGADRIEKDEDGHEIIYKDDYGEPMDIPANTIVINENRVEEQYEDFPIFHECYHYEKHYKAFRLQKLTSSDTRVIKRKRIIIDKDTKRKDHLFLMENQADRAAHGLWMPATDTKRMIIDRIGKAGSYPHRGELFERIGSSVAYRLSVPHFRMRARMIQLGFPEAKGILHYIERKRIRPFAFDPESLRAEELTFVITPAKIKNLCTESDEFRAVTDSKKYVYAEGHMVFNDPMFVQQYGDIYKLTDYAIANVDVCCLRFVRIYVQKNLGEYVLGRMYMDAEYVERTMFYLKDFLKVPDTNTEFAAKKAYKAAFPLIFKDAVEMLKKQSRTQKGESTNEAIAEYMHMAPRTFTDALSNPAMHMNPDFVLALCLYFKLPDWLSSLLFRRAGAMLDEDNPRHAAFMHILRAQSCDGLAAADEYLKSQGLDPLNW